MSESEWEYWRRVQIRGKRLTVYTKRVDEMTELYADKSYALVRYPKPGFVPLVVRHMDNRHFRALFWREPVKIVFNGRHIADSLCELCPNMLACIADGRERRAGFHCNPVGTEIRSNALRRRKGARH